mgnify:CR=1 FL=1
MTSSSSAGLRCRRLAPPQVHSIPPSKCAHDHWEHLRPDLRRPCKPWPAVERNADAPRVARKVEDRELRLKLLGLKKHSRTRHERVMRVRRVTRLKLKKGELVRDLEID